MIGAFMASRPMASRPLSRHKPHVQNPARILVVVTDEEEQASLRQHRIDPPAALPSKSVVLDRKHLIDRHDRLVHLGHDGDADTPSCRSRDAYRGSDEVPQLSEVDDPVEATCDFVFGGSSQLRVFVGSEPSGFQQRSRDIVRKATETEGGAARGRSETTATFN